MPLSEIRAALGNVGNLFYELGQFDRATEYFERALLAGPSNSTHASALLDSMARACLMEGRFEECGAILDRVEATIQREDDRGLYGHRYAQLTRAHLLAGQGDINAALAQVASVSTLATSTGDALLLSRAELTKAALLQRLGRIPECVAVLEALRPELVGESPEMYAQAEQVFACALISNGQRSAGIFHFSVLLHFLGIEQFVRIALGNGLNRNKAYKTQEEDELHCANGFRRAGNQNSPL